MNHFGNTDPTPTVDPERRLRRYLINEAWEISAHYIDFDDGYIKFWEYTKAGEQNFLVRAIVADRINEIEEIR